MHLAIYGLQIAKPARVHLATLRAWWMSDTPVFCQRGASGTCSAAKGALKMREYRKCKSGKYRSDNEWKAIKQKIEILNIFN